MPHNEVKKIQRDRAKQMRREMTRAKTLLWRHLKANRLSGLGFRRQSPMGNYIADFVAQCLPGLAGADFAEVLDVDQCDYDLVADDEFVLGRLPGFTNAFVGVGWRGTGYKFAPWVGRVLAQLALQEGTVYDIARFDPARFDPHEEGGAGVSTVDADTAAAAR